MEDFVVPDEEDSDVPMKSTKRKRSRPSTGRSSPSPSDIPIQTPSRTPSKTTNRFAFNSSAPPSSAPSTPAARKPNPKIPVSAARTKPSKSEQRYKWLVDIRDADGNPPDHPDYDPRTLFIPESAKKEFSPFERQYWDIKSKLYDTVVFFKKGKFYELYEDDATIGNQQFDLKLTDRVNMRMVGVPESSLDMWASQFIAKGYKIARVDQMENALAKEMRERDNKSAKVDKIIKRELACVLTGGTLVDEGMLQDENSTYILALKEEVIDGVTNFGACFADTATAQFAVCQFEDDDDCSKLDTLVAQIRPRELVLEKGCLSTKALRILKTNTALTTLWNKVKSGKEFWDAETTVRELRGRDYFGDDGDEESKWPQDLKEIKEMELALSAFGGLVWYLSSLKIDRELISIGNFEWYDPIRKATSLVLDGQTLQNLEIFQNTFDGSQTGTLFSLLNRCITPFGKRMFRLWLCHPLADQKKIEARYDAVDALNADKEFTTTFSRELSKLPDLERMISRIHAGTTKAQDFCRVLDGFEQIREAIGQLKELGEGEGLIGQLVAAVPDLDSLLKPWESAFDRAKAKDSNVMVPERGVEADFDESQDTIEGYIEQLQEMLESYRKKFKSKDICFRDCGKEIYVLEFPAKISSIPKDWTQISATQKVKRYYSPELKNLVRSLQEAQETHSQIVKEVAGRFYVRFDSHYKEWLATIKIVAQIDCLISLAKASNALGTPSCRPTFVDDERTVLEFEELRHPCMSTSNDFIPNTVALGGSHPNITLLTGANAAGKSTVLRTTCVAVILAQLGCYIPATSARLTPVDRIMSRLGAQDNIFRAQSTFLVELSETQRILEAATPRSLVILDELGRGTSSADGLAVASSVLHHVATHLGCVGFFATHYHSLARSFAFHPEVEPKRMQIDVDEATRTVTFLYKLEQGVAEGSFGMHCASMCGIPSKVVEAAERAAERLEEGGNGKKQIEKEEKVPLGVVSDVVGILRGEVKGRGVDCLIKAISRL